MLNSHNDLISNLEALEHPNLDLVELTHQILQLGPLLPPEPEPEPEHENHTNSTGGSSGGELGVPQNP